MILAGSAVTEHAQESEINQIELVTTLAKRLISVCSTQKSDSENAVLLDESEASTESTFVIFHDVSKPAGPDVREQEKGRESLEAAPFELAAAEASMPLGRRDGSREILCDSGANFSLVTCSIPGTKTISSSRETAHGAFGKAGFTIERKQACLAVLLDAQGQAAHSGELEVAVVSSGWREIVSASQIAKHWGAFPDLKKKVLKLRGGGTVPLLEKNGLYFLKAELGPLEESQSEEREGDNAAAFSAARPFGCKLSENDAVRPHLWTARPREK